MPPGHGYFRRTSDETLDLKPGPGEHLIRQGTASPSNCLSYPVLPIASTGPGINSHTVDTYTESAPAHFWRRTMDRILPVSRHQACSHASFNTWMNSLVPASITPLIPPSSRSSTGFRSRCVIASSGRETVRQFPRKA